MTRYRIVRMKDQSGYGVQAYDIYECVWTFLGVDNRYYFPIGEKTNKLEWKHFYTEDQAKDFIIQEHVGYSVVEEFEL